MWEVQLLTATQAIEKAMAVALYRFSICLGIGFAFVFATLAGAGMGFAVGSFSSSLSGFGHVGGLVGFTACGAVMYWVRDRLLFSVRCPQIAAVVEQMEGRLMPRGSKQIAAARSLVQQRFQDVSLLTELDRKIKSVLANLFHATPQVSGWMPSIAHLPTARLLTALVARPVIYTDAVILAFQLREKEQNLWRAGQTALVLYAQHFKVLLKNALIVYALMYAALVAVFFLMLEPVGWVDEALPESMGWWRYLFALVLAWIIKAGFFEPIAEISMTQLYFDLIKGQEPSPEFEEKLSRLSPSFQKIKERAPIDLPESPPESAGFDPNAESPQEGEPRQDE
jgi:hypothetical protein